VERAEIEVTGLTWDEANEAKVEAHGISAQDVEDVLANQPRFFRNLPDRSAEYVMLGPDSEDRFVFAPIVPTQTVGVWYPVTAYRLDRRRAARIYERGG